MSIELRLKGVARGKQNLEKILYQCHFITINPTRTDPGANPRLHGEKSGIKMRALVNLTANECNACCSCCDSGESAVVYERGHVQ
jgi:hypothetical protein